MSPEEEKLEEISLRINNIDTHPHFHRRGEGSANIFISQPINHLLVGPNKTILSGEETPTPKSNFQNEQNKDNKQCNPCRTTYIQCSFND